MKLKFVSELIQIASLRFIEALEGSKITPPFTRKRMVSLCFGRYVRIRLGVAISEVSGPPVFHIKVGRPV